MKAFLNCRITLLLCSSFSSKSDFTIANTCKNIISTSLNTFSGRSGARFTTSEHSGTSWGGLGWGSGGLWDTEDRTGDAGENTAGDSMSGDLSKKDFKHKD